VPPAPALGDVVSAHTNGRTRDGAVSRLFRGGTRRSYVGDAGVHEHVQGVLGAPTNTVVRFAEAESLPVSRSCMMRGGTYVIQNGRLYADPPLGTSPEAVGTSGANFGALLVVLKTLGYPLR
jgi:hypothetical protein